MSPKGPQPNSVGRPFGKSTFLFGQIYAVHKHVKTLCTMISVKTGKNNIFSCFYVTTLSPSIQY